MLVKNGHQYSKVQFHTYTFRAIIIIYAAKVGELNLNIYTTDGDRESIIKTLKEHSSEEVFDIKLTDLITREQDDNTEKFINEWLNQE